MINELIAMVFGSEGEALTVKESILMMQNSRALGATAAVPVTKDSKGFTTVHLQDPNSTYIGAGASHIAGFLAQAMFGRSSVGDTQKVINSGLDNLFVSELNSSLIPDSSLLFFYVRRDSLADSKQILDVLYRFKGKVWQTTVSDELEESLLG